MILLSAVIPAIAFGFIVLTPMIRGDAVECSPTDCESGNSVDCCATKDSCILCSTLYPYSYGADDIHSSGIEYCGTSHCNDFATVRCCGDNCCPSGYGCCDAHNNCVACAPSADDDFISMTDDNNYLTWSCGAANAPCYDRYNTYQKPNGCCQEECCYGDESCCSVVGNCIVCNTDDHTAPARSSAVTGIIVGVVIGFSGIICLVRVSWFFFKRHHYNTVSPHHMLMVHTHSQTRIEGDATPDISGGPAVPYPQMRGPTTVTVTQTYTRTQVEMRLPNGMVPQVAVPVISGTYPLSSTGFAAIEVPIAATTSQTPVLGFLPGRPIPTYSMPSPQNIYAGDVAHGPTTIQIVPVAVPVSGNRIL
jgi:hypothetical protein